MLEIRHIGTIIQASFSDASYAWFTHNTYMYRSLFVIILSWLKSNFYFKILFANTIPVIYVQYHRGRKKLPFFFYIMGWKYHTNSVPHCNVTHFLWIAHTQTNSDAKRFDVFTVFLRTDTETRTHNSACSRTNCIPHDGRQVPIIIYAQKLKSWIFNAPKCFFSLVNLQSKIVGVILNLFIKHN